MAQAKKAIEVLISVERIVNRIYLVRGQKVMLDEDLAALYRVPTGTLNQAVRRKCLHGGPRLARSLLILNGDKEHLRPTDTAQGKRQGDRVACRHIRNYHVELIQANRSRRQAGKRNRRRACLSEEDLKR